MSTNYEEKINQMYDSQLTSQKEQLKTDYETTLSDMAAQQAQQQKELERKLRDTRVDSQRAAVSNAEYYNAAGLSSGARAQARLSQENQLLADLTALRAAQQQADDETERQRTLLAKEFSSAIQKAQAENDLARAQALYEEAKDADAKLLAKEEAAANLMAQTGDYTRLGALYGLTPEEIKKLSGKSSGSYGSGGGGGSVNNGSRSKAEIIAMQRALGIAADGQWGPRSQAAAKQRWGTTSADEAWKANNDELYRQYQSEQAARNAKENSYNNILASYISVKKSGASQRELDMALRRYVADGTLTEAEATRLRMDADDAIRRGQ